MNEQRIMDLIYQYGRACAQEQAWRTANVIWDRSHPEGDSPSELLETIRKTIKEE